MTMSHVNETRFAYESGNLRYEWVMPHSYVINVSICIIAHQSMTMSRMNELRRTYEYVMLRSYVGRVFISVIAYQSREIMLFIGKLMGRSKMISIFNIVPYE